MYVWWYKHDQIERHMKSPNIKDNIFKHLDNIYIYFFNWYKVKMPYLWLLLNVLYNISLFILRVEMILECMVSHYESLTFTYPLVIDLE